MVPPPSVVTLNVWKQSRPHLQLAEIHCYRALEIIDSSFVEQTEGCVDAELGQGYAVFAGLEMVTVVVR